MNLSLSFEILKYFGHVGVYLHQKRTFIVPYFDRTWGAAIVTGKIRSNQENARHTSSGKRHSRGVYKAVVNEYISNI